MIVLGLCAAFILGVWTDIVLRRENGCPLVELGYNCKGETCDHRLSELYKAKATMAQNQEEYEERRRRLADDE